MDLALLFFGLLWALSGRGASSAPAPAPAPPYDQRSPGWPRARPRPPQLPPPQASWPAGTPPELPPFPGQGWQYDEPPPQAVKDRARALVSQLWGTGQGTYQLERTEGRWIVYRAEIVASGKKGVVAYRQRGTPPAKRAPAPPRAASPEYTVRTGPATIEPERPRQGTTVLVNRTSSPMDLPTLRKGMGAPPAPPHPDVILLQQKLGITADGWFGGGTEKAVRAYQKRKGLTVDGEVGKQTWTSLFSVRAPEASA